MNAVEVYEKASWDVDHSKITFGEFEERIKSLYDVEPVRHGHWEQEQPQYRLYKCSACNKVCFAEKWGDETVLYNYCPNCGARMDGDNDE